MQIFVGMSNVWRIIMIFAFVPFVVAQTKETCGEPRKYQDKLLDNQNLVKSVFRNLEKVVYKCAPGYTQTGGSPTSVCVNGQWTHLNMQCERYPPAADISNSDTSSVKCPVIDLPNGMVVNAKDSPREALFNTVQVTCSPGFRLNGAQELRCGADGSWTPNVPTCEPVKCPVTEVPNGIVDGNVKGSPREVVFDTVVRITCIRGFKLVGANQLRCGADGSWTPDVPTCEPVKCPVIDIPNGTIVKNGRGSLPEAAFNTVVQITCSPGFKLNGAQELRCGADGSWTHSIPICEPVTCPVIDVSNGWASPREAVFDTIVQITCSPGFKLNGAQELRCGADGSWTPSVPTCEPVKCPVIDVTNGLVSPQEVVFDTNVQIACSPGFRLNGAQELHCGADGSWTPSVPTCEPVTCPVIDIPNGQVVPPAVVFDTSVQITCSPGFRLNGAQTLHCGADGSWMPNVPTCEPVTCSPPVVENGVINGEAPWYKPEDTVIIMCRRGFNMTGSPQVTCGLDGQWQALPRCLNEW